MPFVEVFTREELSDAVRAKLAETLLVTMMNIEIGHPTDHARAIGWVWFHTMPVSAWAVGGRFDDTYIKGRKMGLARIIALMAGYEASFWRVLHLAVAERPILAGGIDQVDPMVEDGQAGSDRILIGDIAPCRSANRPGTQANS